MGRFSKSEGEHIEAIEAAQVEVADGAPEFVDPSRDPADKSYPSHVEAPPVAPEGVVLGEPSDPGEVKDEVPRLWQLIWEVDPNWKPGDSTTHLQFVTRGTDNHLSEVRRADDGRN